MTTIEAMKFGGCPSCGKQNCLVRTCEHEESQTVEPDHIGDTNKMVLGERDALIDGLSFTAAASSALRPMCIAAADMLAADAPRVPMTEPEINKMYRAIPKTDDVVVELVRATEAHHKIGVKP